MRLAFASQGIAKSKSKLAAAALLAAPTLMLVGAPHAFAADKYLDINGTVSGSGITNGSTISWSTSAVAWGNSAGTGSTTAWTSNSDNAFFSAGTLNATTTYNISIGTGGGIAANVTVEDGQLTISSGNVSASGQITVTNGASLSINASGQLAGAGTVVLLDGGTLKNTAATSALSFISSGKELRIGASGGTVDYTSSGTGTVSIYTGTITGVGGTTANGGANTLSVDSTGEFRVQGSTTANFTFAKLNVEKGIYRIGNAAGSAETGFGAVPTAALADAITLNGGSIGVSLTLTTHANRGITIGANGGTFNMSAASLTVGGAITGSSGGALNVTGSQALRLNSAMSIDGDFNVTNSATTTLIENGTAASLSGSGPISISSGKILTANGSTTTTYTGVLSGSGQFTRTGGGTTVITNEWTNTGATNITNGTLKFNVSSAGLGNSSQVNIGASGTLNMNGVNDTIGSLVGAGSIINGANLTLSGNNTSTAAFSGSYSGSGVLTKNGTGAQTFSGSNSFSGVNFSDGRINFNNNNAVGSGTIAVGAGADEFVSTANGIVLSNAITLAGTTTKFYATTGNSLQLGGPISGAGGILRDDTGAGTLTLSGNNSFAGGVTVTSRGIVIGHKKALGNGTLTLGDAVTNPANTITIQSNTDLTGANAVANAVTANKNFTVTGSSDLELSGAIGGSGALTKTGAGDLILSNANSYSGGTTIQNGSLVANNSSGNATGSGLVKVSATGILTTTTGGSVGAVDVVAGGLITAAPSQILVVNGDATIAGTSSGNIQYNGNVVVTGTMAPGNSPGVVTVSGNLTLSGDTDMELAGTASNQYDQINVTGVLNFGGDLNVALINAFTPSAGDTFDLFDFGSFTGAFANIYLPSLETGLVWDTSKLYTTGEISVASAVPLPGSAWAGLGLVGGLVAVRRFRKVLAV